MYGLGEPHVWGKLRQVFVQFKIIATCLQFSLFLFVSERLGKLGLNEEM